MSLLEDAYDPEEFRDRAHKLVDQLADYLTHSIYQQQDTMFRKFDSEELYQGMLKNLDQQASDFSNWVDEVIVDSIHLHNPGYMGHQVSPVLPQAALADFMSAMLNNGVGVYEMGSPTVAMERAVIKHLANIIGFDEDADGVLTSGGTLGNLTALLAARQVKSGGDTWNEGTSDRQLGVMVSEEAHYSIARAAKILGWGSAGIIKVPVDGRYRLDTSKLKKIYESALEEGIQIIAAVGSACSTATGSFDPLEKIAAFCEEQGLWFHVDAAHGGAALYSEKHQPLLEGIDRADSVIVDFHKMLMCPALVTGLVFKNGSYSYQTFAQNAEYLWKQEGAEWFNLGKRTFECTKDMMALKVYNIIHEHGTDLFEENIERLFKLGKSFAGMIEDHPDFELLISPQSNIVCFRHAPAGCVDLDSHNENVRRMLIEEGKYFIVQTNINNGVYLRTSLMNPFTTEAHLKQMLGAIERLAPKT